MFLPTVANPVPTHENLLLAALPGEKRSKLMRYSRKVDLRLGKVLHFADQEITEVYFPLDCMISVTVVTSDGRTAEAGAVGSREMVGVTCRSIGYISPENLPTVDFT